MNKVYIFLSSVWQPTEMVLFVIIRLEGSAILGCEVLLRRVTHIFVFAMLLFIKCRDALSIKLVEKTIIPLSSIILSSPWTSCKSSEFRPDSLLGRYLVEDTTPFSLSAMANIDYDLFFVGTKHITEVRLLGARWEGWRWVLLGETFGSHCQKR